MNLIEITNILREESEEPNKLSKEAVLYLYRENTQYECKDCQLWIKNNRCMIHGPDDEIKSFGSCGYWIHGTPLEEGHPNGAVTKTQSGYTENQDGFSCKRCEYFSAEKLKCAKVDQNSKGDTPGIIHQDACCNAWDKA